jgi:hypothetical protein
MKSDLRCLELHSRVNCTDNSSERGCIEALVGGMSA